MSRSGASRGDIALLTPLPDRAARGVAASDVRPAAPLFAGRSAASTSRLGAESGAGAYVPASAAAANGRRFNFVSSDRRSASSSFRDFAGERARRGNSGGSNGSGGFSAGGGGSAGGWGGVSGTARGNNGSSGSSNRANGNRASNSSGGQSGSRSASGSSGGGIAATTTAAASPVIGGVIATAPITAASPGTSATPEPLTLLLVGTGLAGLFGARKHLAG